MNYKKNYCEAYIIVMTDKNGARYAEKNTQKLLTQIISNMNHCPKYRYLFCMVHCSFITHHEDKIKMSLKVNISRIIYMWNLKDWELEEDMCNMYQYLQTVSLLSESASRKEKMCRSNNMSQHKDSKIALCYKRETYEGNLHSIFLSLISFTFFFYLILLSIESTDLD